MKLETDVIERFHFTRAMLEGPIYRKYEKAIGHIWNPLDLDYAADGEVWQRLSEERRHALLKITVRFFAGEQAVTDELLPMVAAAHALRKYDWTMYLSTFMMEEAKHSQFFACWHERVAGILEPEEVAKHWVERSAAVDPTGRFQPKEVLYGEKGLPRYGRELLEAVVGGDEAQIEAGFVRFATLYNGFAEGVLTMPSYEIVLDTAELYGGLPALTQGFRRILADEGRHITFGTEAIRSLIEKNPAYEQLVHDVFDDFRANAVGLVEYQKAIPGLDVRKYQTQKVRHYRNRCREMGITPDQTLIEQILDPSIEFVVGVEAG